MKHQKTRKKRVFATIGCVCLAVFGYFSYTLVDTLIQYKKGVQAYDTLMHSAIGAETSSTVPGPASIQVDFTVLQKINPEIAGWLYCEGTAINYPVVKGSDNRFYLNHLYDRTKNISGTLFIDYRNGVDCSDENTVVYGHHMKNGSMFASLVQYKAQAYFEEHPTLYLLTPKGKYRVELFAGFICDSVSPAFTRKFASAKDYASYLENAKEKSDFKSNVSVTSQDHILTLSTCTYEYDDARYVVSGKLVPLP